jgi:hypothetical protein
LAHLPNLSLQMTSAHALVRFGLRMIILFTFAAFGGSFGKSLAALLWMAIILCAVVGTMRREPIFASVLNHWDEMIAYAAGYALVSGLSQ